MFDSSPISGLRTFASLKVADARGSFTNLFRLEDIEYSECWSGRSVSQVNISSNVLPGTIRGLHTQLPPYSDAKIVRCLSGKIWDVIVDLRRDSPTFGSHFSLTLSPESCNAVFIPEGCAHGFQTLSANSQVLYLHSAPWRPEYETGVRFDDPTLAIPWPLSPVNVSNRDLTLPFLCNY